jgi:hypothetical protein
MVVIPVFSQRQPINPLLRTWINEAMKEGLHTLIHTF